MKLSELITSEMDKDGWSPVVWSLFRESVDPEVVARLSVPGEPASKSRPRFSGKGHKTRAYTPEETRQAEEIIGWHFRKARPDWRQPDPEGAYGVFAKFYAGNHQRRDVDNMLKLILDACNKLVWVDDAQVSEVSGRILRGVAEPSTEVIIYRTWHAEGDKGGPSYDRTCEQCQRSFRIYPSWKDKRFCSRKCASEALRDKRKKECAFCGKEFREIPSAPKEFCSAGCRARGTIATVTCTGCGQEFSRPRSMIRRRVNAFCNAACHAAYWRDRRPKLAAGACSVCGAPTSKKSYKRCNSCKLAGAPLPGLAKS